MNTRQASSPFWPEIPRTSLNGRCFINPVNREYKRSDWDLTLDRDANHGDAVESHQQRRRNQGGESPTHRKGFAFAGLHDHRCRGAPVCTDDVRFWSGHFSGTRGILSSRHPRWTKSRTNGGLKEKPSRAVETGGYVCKPRPEMERSSNSSSNLLSVKESLILC